MFLILILCLTIASATALEKSNSSTSTAVTPRELAIKGNVAREYSQSKKSGRIKSETFSAVLANGSTISLECIYQKNKPPKFSGYIKKDKEKFR